MKFVIVIYPDAEDELKELVIYLNRHKPGLGDRLLDDYEKTLKFLEQFAEAIPKRNGNLRHVLVGKFPIMLIYIVQRRRVHIRKVIRTGRDEKSRYKR